MQVSDGHDMDHYAADVAAVVERDADPAGAERRVEQRRSRRASRGLRPNFRHIGAVRGQGPDSTRRVGQALQMTTMHAIWSAAAAT